MIELGQRRHEQDDLLRRDAGTFCLRPFGKGVLLASAAPSDGNGGDTAKYTRIRVGRATRHRFAVFREIYSQVLQNVHSGLYDGMRATWGELLRRSTGFHTLDEFTLEQYAVVFRSLHACLDDLCIQVRQKLGVNRTKVEPSIEHPAEWR